MSKYNVRYAYMAQGMDFPDDYDYIIEADTELEAIYMAHRKYGFWKGSTFEEFKQSPKHIQYWATTVKKIGDDDRDN
jgi:hypothetical protein